MLHECHMATLLSARKGVGAQRDCMQLGRAVAMLCAGAMAIALSVQRLACCVVPNGTAGSSKGCSKARCKCSKGPVAGVVQAPDVMCLLASLGNACTADKQCPELCLPALHDPIDDRLLICLGTSLQSLVDPSRRITSGWHESRCDLLLLSQLGSAWSGCLRPRPGKGSPLPWRCDL